jgi:hypothetical protein
MATGTLYLVISIRMKAEGKRPLGRPRRRCVHNIKIDLVELRCGGRDLTDVAEDRDRRRASVDTTKSLRMFGTP